MSSGYSTDFVRRMRSANRALLGVRLGRYCIKHEIPVSSVAKRFKVSRATVYKWFSGEGCPRDSLHPQMARFIGE